MATGTHSYDAAARKRRRRRRKIKGYCTFACCAVLAHAVYVLLGRALKQQFASASRVRLFNRISGGLFVALGFSLLSLRNKAA